jgi:hypothetical protein
MDGWRDGVSGREVGWAVLFWGGPAHPSFSFVLVTHPLLDAKSGWMDGVFWSSREERKKGIFFFLFFRKWRFLVWSGLDPTYTRTHIHTYIELWRRWMDGWMDGYPARARDEEQAYSLTSKMSVPKGVVGGTERVIENSISEIPPFSLLFKYGFYWKELMFCSYFVM